MNVMTVLAKLMLDADQYKRTMDDAEAQAEAVGQAIGDKIAKGTKVAAAAVGAVGAAIGVVAKQIWSNTKATAEYGDKVDKMSQKIGISTDAYQEWAYVMDMAGGSADNLLSGMRTLSKVLVDAAEGSQSAFEALEAVGLEIEDLEGMTLEEQLNVVIGALGEMESGAERNAAAQELLGKSAMDLAPLLNMTAEEIEAAKQEAHELGMIMGEDDVIASATMMDALTRFQSTLIGIRNTIFSDFIPGLTTMLDGFTALVSGSDDASEQIVAGFTNIIDTMSSNIPEFLDVAVKIVIALVDGINSQLDRVIDITIDLMFTIIDKIIDMLPDIGKSAIRIIVTLVENIADRLPDIIDSAITIMMTLVDTLVEALPRLIPAVVKIMLTIVKKLTEPETLAMLVTAALELIVALALGLIEALPELTEQLPVIVTNMVEALIRLAPQLLRAGVEMITKLVNGIVEAFPQIDQAMLKAFNRIKDKVTGWFASIKEWGKDLIRNFVAGITEMFDSIGETFTNLGNKIKGLIGFSEPKEGPLSDFHTYAPDMMKLFAQGIKDNEDLLTAQIEKSFDIEGTLRQATDAPSTSRDMGGKSTELPINITVQSVLDGRVIAESVYKYQRSQQRVYGR